MLDKILPLSKKLISIKSTSENREELKKILKIALKYINTDKYTIERFEKNASKSVLVYNTNKRPKKFKILLNAHLDIIPGKEQQYTPRVEDNKLYGVGAIDMKASAACLILVFKELGKKVNYPLGLQLVTDEETGGFNGTKYQLEKGVRAEFTIVGEATNLHIENKAKGILWAKISAKGKSAHAAYPWRGENAVWKMKKFLNLLERQYPLPKKERWVTTINLSSIKTLNQTFNKIPDFCEVWFDIRYIPKDSKVIVSNIEKLLPKEFNLKIVLKEPAISVNSSNPYIKLLQETTRELTQKKPSLKASHGSSDVRHFSRVNCTAVEFGPSGEGMGSDNEWVDLTSLKNYYQILKNFLLKIA